MGQNTSKKSMFYLKKCDYPSRIPVTYDAAVPEIANCRLDGVYRKTITRESFERDGRRVQATFAMAARFAGTGFTMECTR